jgi:hypothetical protein
MDQPRETRTPDEMYEALLEVEAFIERVTDWLGGDIAARQRALYTLRSVYLSLDISQHDGGAALRP